MRHKLTKMMLPLLLLFWLVTLVKAQRMGGQKEDKKVDLQWTKCRRGAGGKPICTTMSSPLVIDFNWRWLHKKSGTFQNCYLGNKWIQDVCGVNDNTNRCTDACVGEGGVYDTEYGVRTDGDELTIRLVTQNGGNTNVGARLMMLDGTGSRYLQHMLLDQEVTFDIDVSAVPCGLVPALYFTSMDADGGAKAYKSAGASAGLGYADGQCARDLKFINGKVTISLISILEVFPPTFGSLLPAKTFLLSLSGEQLPVGAIDNRPQCRCGPLWLLWQRSRCVGGQLGGKCLYASPMQVS